MKSSNKGGIQMKNLKGRNKRTNNLRKVIVKITKHPLFKNKLYGSLMIILGIVGTILTKDLTIFIMCLLFGLPVIFAKKNVIV